MWTDGCKQDTYIHVHRTSVVNLLRNDVDRWTACITIASRDRLCFGQAASAHIGAMRCRQSRSTAQMRLDTGQPHPAMLWLRSKINSGRFIAKRRADGPAILRPWYMVTSRVSSHVQKLTNVDPFILGQRRLITFPLSASPLHNTSA